MMAGDEVCILERFLPVWSACARREWIPCLIFCPYVRICIQECYFYIWNSSCEFIGVRAGGTGGCSPPKFWATQNFWAAREIWLSQFLKMFSSFFWIDRHFLFLPEVGIVKPAKFTRDSGCLARNELLYISKGDHKLIYIFLFFLGGEGRGGGAVLYCTALAAGVVN